MGEQRSGRGGLILLAIAIVVVGAIVASVTVAQADTRPPEKPVHVVKWPADLAPIAQTVEKIRGLRFRHAVPVRHIHVPANGTAAPLDARTRASLEANVEPLVAFGLVSPDHDVAMLVGTSSDTPAGVYTPEREVIRVYVRTGNAFGHAVLAHELTHALEDQHFPQSERRTARMPTQIIVSRAVIEGSASRVERLYAGEQWQPSYLQQTRPGNVELGTGAYVRKWEWFAALSVAPYALGSAYIDATLARGDVSWDEITEDTPLSDVVLVDPLAPPGSLWQARGIPSTTFNEPAALEVYLLLASRVDPAAALEAMNRSSGSMLVNYERDGRPCSDLTLLTRTPNDPAVTATIDQWIAAAGPANASRSSVVNGTRIVEPSRTPNGAPTVFSVPAGAPILTSCRGVAPAAFGSFVVPLSLLIGRDEAAARAMRRGLDEATTACVARAVLTDSRFRAHLEHAVGRDPTFSADPPESAYRRAVAGCEPTE